VLKRLNLELPKVLYLRIKELEGLSESTSLSEVLRKALSAYDVLLREQKSGKRIVIKDGNREREVLLV
jgi:predicted transcriptional regulator